jgi:hypothetical protein
MKFRRSRWLLGGMLAGAALLFLSSGPARADIRMALENGSPTMEGSNFRWTYDVFLQPATELDVAGGGIIGQTQNPGNFATLYDVNGLVPNSPVTLSPSLAALFAASVQNVGRTPPEINPVDNPNVPNISLTYMLNMETNLAPGAAELLLGNFSFLSTIGVIAQTDYAAATQRNNPGFPDDEGIANNLATAAGPAPAPEPSTIALVCAGVPVLLGMAARRRLKRRAA